MGNLLPRTKKVPLFRSIGNTRMVGRVDRPGMAFEHPTLPDGLLVVTMAVAQGQILFQLGAKRKWRGVLVGAD
jgi:hypothetical protein